MKDTGDDRGGNDVSVEVLWVREINRKSMKTVQKHEEQSLNFSKQYKELKENK